MALPPYLQFFSKRRLNQVIIPGSHDAGLAAQFHHALSFVGSASRTVTQDKSIAEQAKAGSRFFDVRIMNVGGELKTFHTMKNPMPWAKSDTRKIGASGESFTSIVDGLRDFVRDHDSEFVVVRLSHLRDSAEVFAELWDWMVANDKHVYRGTGNLALKTVGDLAGKIVFVVESKKMKHALKPPPGAPNGSQTRVPTQADGFHRFYSSKGGALPTVEDGLCLCGEFSNKGKVGEILDRQIKHYTHHDQHKNCIGQQAHLYALYWTATGGNIKDNTAQQLTSENFKKVRQLVADTTAKNWGDELEANKTALLSPGTNQAKQRLMGENQARAKFSIKAASIPNVIFYDFVNDDTSQEIIDLNDLVNH
ncbi:MAG: hypothetical protein U1F50_14910 [Rubrivivax sp.]